MRVGQRDDLERLGLRRACEWSVRGRERVRGADGGKRHAVGERQLARASGVVTTA